MILLLTGTPGTGKSSVATRLSKKTGMHLIRVNDIVDEGLTIGVDVKRGSKIVDTEKLEARLGRLIRGDTIVEGHLSHLLSGDVVVVLRTRPDVLETRLGERGFDEEKVRENVEAEAIDVCLVESLEFHTRVYEVDTSEKTPGEAAGDILKILDGETRGYEPGKIDWSEGYFG